MPQRLNTEVDHDAPTPLRFVVPGWMKIGAAAAVARDGKSLSEWLKDEMRQLIERAGTDPRTAAPARPEKAARRR